MKSRPGHNLGSPPWVTTLGSPLGSPSPGVPGGHDERYCKLGCAETHARCGKERALGRQRRWKSSLEWSREMGGEMGKSHPFKLAGKSKMEVPSSKVGKGGSF